MPGQRCLAVKAQGEVLELTAKGGEMEPNILVIIHHTFIIAALFPPACPLYLFSSRLPSSPAISFPPQTLSVVPTSPLTSSPGSIRPIPVLLSVEWAG